MSEFDFVGEAKRIVEAAQKEGITLRVLGAVAFRIQCPEYVQTHIAMGRTLSDIDFAADFKQDEKIEKWFLSGMHFKGQQRQAALTPGLFHGRHIYEDPATGLHVDIFFDELNMCHRVPFTGRLNFDPYTITLADLVLEKVQIVTLNEKDVRDMLMLLAAKPVGEVEQNTINGAYIAEMMGKDWGFYYTTTTNLAKIKAAIPRYANFFNAEEQARIAKRLDELMDMIEKKPKTLKWKARAAVGTRVQWYNDVEEVERADHLSDIG